MAAIWNLPVVFVLENNHYGVSTRIEDVIADQGPLHRARQGYGMPGVRVDGFDVLAVYEACRRRWRAPARRWPHAAGHRVLPPRGPLLPANRRSTAAVPRSRSGARSDPIPASAAYLLRERHGDRAELDAIERGDQAGDGGGGRVRQGQPRCPIRRPRWTTSTPERGKSLWLPNATRRRITGRRRSPPSPPT